MALANWHETQHPVQSKDEAGNTRQKKKKGLAFLSTYSSVVVILMLLCAGADPLCVRIILVLRLVCYGGIKRVTLSVF